MSQKTDLLRNILHEADIEVSENSNRPQDIQIKQHFLGLLAHEFLSRGNLGLGELFEAGVWDCENLQKFYRHLLEAEIRRYPLRNPVSILKRPSTWPSLAQLASQSVADIYRHQFTNLQEQEHAHEIGEAHYDKVHDLAPYMLGPHMAYSCAHWGNASTLEEAQEEKFELLCEKMQLSPEDRLLDIGCGWGSMMQYAQKQYGVEAVGITVSEEQAEYINQELGSRLTAHVLDYRELNSWPEPQFDAAVSIGMFEHVGPHNYGQYMRSVKSTLKTGGRFALQSIATYKHFSGTDPWIDKYIFPRGKFPSINQAETEMEQEFDLLSSYDFAEPISHRLEAYYKQTLDAWLENLQTAIQSGRLSIPEWQWRRMRLYLMTCAAMFSADHSKQATVIQLIGRKE